MKVGSLSDTQFGRHLANGTVSIRTGPFRLAVRSSVPRLAPAVARLYADHDCELDPSFADFHVAAEPVRRLPNPFRPQVQFSLDGQNQFLSLPRAQALPLLEWGLNWCIASHGHSYVVLHAASLERDGRAIIMPGPPGSGKSTLCAALVLDGWRLLSDELTLVSLEDGTLAALARPISLKNAAIDIIKSRCPDAVFSASVGETGKGTIALMKAPADSIARVHETAEPGWVVFPRYRSGARTELSDRPKEETIIELAENAFNYSLYGRKGFEIMVKLGDAVHCAGIVYDSLDEAVARISSLP